MTYRVTPNGNLRKNLELKWMRVDDIRRDSVDDHGYIDQIAETHRPPPGGQPFKLDEVVAQYFREALPNHPRLRPTMDGPMPIPSRKDVDAFLTELVARAKAGN